LGLAPKKWKNPDKKEKKDCHRGPIPIYSSSYQIGKKKKEKKGKKKRFIPVGPYSGEKGKKLEKKKRGGRKK